MTDTEIKAALIHIKRHIYSKPIKKYISDLLKIYYEKEKADGKV